MKGSARLPFISVSGSAYERGFEYGTRLRHELRAFVADRLARINIVRRVPLSRGEALRRASGYAEVIEADVPEIAEELRGVAAGSVLSYPDVLLLQTRRELVGTGLDCTALAGKDEDGRTFIAQNVDLPGGLADLAMILRVQGQLGSPDILMFTHLGLLGYLGVNSHGLAIGINMVLAAGWRPGVPPYLLVRHLLQQRSIDACMEEIRRVRRSSSRNLIIAQGHRVVSVEMTVDAQDVLESDFMIHTNHYLSPRLASFEQLPAGGSSHARLARATQLVAASARLNERALRSVLSDHAGPHGICVHASDPRSAETIASVILNPETGSIRATAGHPCRAPYLEYRAS